MAATQRSTASIWRGPSGSCCPTTRSSSATPTWAGTTDVLESVSRAARRPMPGGCSFELLRFLSPVPGVRGALNALPRADLLFNYAGAEDEAGHGSLFAPAPEPVPPEESRRGLRRRPIDGAGMTLTPALRLTFVYSTNLHTAEGIAGEGRRRGGGDRWTPGAGHRQAPDQGQRADGDASGGVVQVRSGRRGPHLLRHRVIAGVADALPGDHDFQGAGDDRTSIRRSCCSTYSRSSANFSPGQRVAAADLGQAGDPRGTSWRRACSGV